jgi:hypothetical protein
MSFSKASVTLLFRRLSVYQGSVFNSVTPIVSVGAWAVFSLFASIFQCSLPNPWRGPLDSCPTREGLWSTVIILNIISDFILAVYIIPGVWKLNMAKSMRLTVLSLFASRITVCVTAAVQLFRLIQHAHSGDETCKSNPMRPEARTVY